MAAPDLDRGLWPHRFQSPSRGGRLCGAKFGAQRDDVRGFQSPSRGGRLCGAARLSRNAVMFLRFSPLHEGDASVAVSLGLRQLQIHRFSPLHEGDASVARPCARPRPGSLWVSVPFTRGTPLWRERATAQTSRGNNVSVPFTRGTPLWRPARPRQRPKHRRFSPLHEGDASVAYKRVNTGVE